MKSKNMSGNTVWLALLILLFFNSSIFALNFSPAEVREKLKAKRLNRATFTIEPNTKTGEYRYIFSYDNCLADAFLPGKVTNGVYSGSEWVGAENEEGVKEIYFRFDTRHPIIEAQIAFSAMFAAPERYADVYLNHGNEWRKIYDGLTGGKTGRLEDVVISKETLAPLIKGSKEALLCFNIHKHGLYFSGIASHHRLFPFFQAVLDVSDIPAYISAMSPDELIYGVGKEMKIKVDIVLFTGKDSAFTLILKLFDDKGNLAEKEKRELNFSNNNKREMTVTLPTKNLPEGDYKILGELVDNNNNIVAERWSGVIPIMME